MTSEELRIALILKLDELSDSAVEKILEFAISLTKLERFYEKHGKEKADKMIDAQIRKGV